MAGQVQSGVMNQGNVGFGRMGSIDPLYDMEADPRWSPSSFQCYQRRGIQAMRDRANFFSLWPGFSFNSGDAGAYTPAGLAEKNYGLFEPYSCDGEGTQTQNFLRGQCVDSNNAAVSGAVVDAFVTATDLYVGTGTSFEDGGYCVSVPSLRATTHYLVAYKTGSPDAAGVTVNTLTPTNVDGT